MQQYRERRNTLLKQIEPDGVVIIPSASLIHRNGDSHYRFRQASDFYYLTGFSEPDALLLLIPGHPDGEFILFNQPRHPEQEIWTGKRAGQEGACKMYGADKAFSIEELDERISYFLQNRKHLYYPLGMSKKFEAKLSMRWIPRVQQLVRKGVTAPSELHAIQPILSEMRLFKSKEEIQTMKKAAEITANAHQKAMQICKPGMYEYQLEAEIMHIFLKEGARAPAYDTIVGGGENACVLHYTENAAQLKSGDLVLIDAGAEYENYASDVTRTFPVNGKFTEEQRQIYELVLCAQLEGISKVKPGNLWTNVQETIVKIITEGLVKLGILSGNVSELIQKKSYLQFYMHNSGHWLGLDVHDAGAYKVNQSWRPLKAGMVLTVEPGIYIAPAENVDKKWWNIGVRIEDDVLVTDKGCDVLTAACPKSIEEIEKLMSHHHV